MSESAGTTRSDPAAPVSTAAAAAPADSTGQALASAAATAAAAGTIEITFKLYASLTEHLPAQHRTSNRMQLQVARNATIAQVIEPFALPMKLVHLVLINGHYMAPAERDTRTLQPGDVLAIWPPIAGG